MIKHRKYDWLGLIKFNNATEEFLKYQRKHKNVSLNRSARAFCQKKHFVTWGIFDSDFCDRLANGSGESI